MSAGERQVTKYFLGRFEGREYAKKLFAKIKHSDLQSLMLNLFLVVEDMMKVRWAVTNEFKFRFKQGDRCCLYVRPALEKFDIYPASLSKEQVKKKAASQGLRLDVEDNTGNKADQFHAKIAITHQWLAAHTGDRLAVLLFIKQLLRDLPDQTK